MGAGSGSAGLIGAGASAEGEMDPIRRAYLRLVEKGNRPVMGECTEADHVGWTEISVFEFQATEKHHPRKTNDFRIRKEMDRIGPLLFTHLTSSEPFESLTIDVMQVDKTGETPKLWGRWQFTTAVVVSIKNATPDRLDPKAQENTPTLQDVTFTFEKVEPIRPPAKTSSDQGDGSIHVTWE